MSCRKNSEFFRVYVKDGIEDEFCGETLFIMSLKYPLINAINIKINELKNRKADIILDDNKST